MATKQTPTPELDALRGAITERTEHLNSLSRALQQLEQRRGEVGNRLADARSSAALTLSRRAAVLTSAAWDGTSDAVIDSEPDLQQEYRALDEQVELHRRAIELQLRLIDESRSRYAAAVGVSAKPQHVAVVREVAVALCALSRALDAERAFCDRMQQAGASMTRMSVDGVGSLSDPNSRASAYLRECVERGFLSADEREQLRTDKAARGLRVVA